MPDRLFITPHFHVQSGGSLTLEALNFRGDGMIYLQDAASGATATTSNKSPAGTAGNDAYGSILNEGTLVLDRVRIDGTVAIAQNGGKGGRGGRPVTELMRPARPSAPAP